MLRNVLILLIILPMSCADGDSAELAALGDEDLGALSAKADGDAVREASLVLEPGAVKRYRIKAVSFHAELRQTGEVVAQLSAKHYEHDIYGEEGTSPTVVAQADDAVRNWTLRVANLGDEPLDAVVAVYAGLPEVEPADAEPSRLGIVSDIDKTVLPPHDIHDGEASLPDAYPGVAALYTHLDLGDDGEAGDTWFVTARKAGMVDAIPQWMEEQGLPAGTIDTGAESFWDSENEKVRDITAIFEANPEHRFVLFGDSSHRDPEVYRRIVDAFGDRVAAVFIHKVNNPNPARVEGMHLHEGYDEVASLLAEQGLLTEDAAAEVIGLAAVE